MTSTPTLDLPGMTAMSPRSTMMTMGSTGYDLYGTPRTMVSCTESLVDDVGCFCCDICCSESVVT